MAIENTLKRYFDPRSSIVKSVLDRRLSDVIIGIKCSFNYTRQKKKRTTTIFPLRSPFNTKMLIIMTYLFLIKIY